MNNCFFKVLRSGVNTTFQDKGRFGLQHLGVPPGGCMDFKSFLFANILLGNEDNCGAIEFAYQGPLLKLINGKTKIVITGDVYFKIINSNNEVMDGECNRTYDLMEGDQIDILTTNKSAYGYLSVEGGFKIESFYSSVSTLVKAKIGPNNGCKIANNDTIIINRDRKSKKNLKVDIFIPTNNVIRVLRGPQYKYFSEESKKIFFSQLYKVTKLTDRMGMRLNGPVLKNIVNTNIRSEGITKGAIQIPEDGQPIILLSDHPTIGGYPKIANVITADYDLLVQKTPETNIAFKCIDLEEAENLNKYRHNNILKITKDIREIK